MTISTNYTRMIYNILHGFIMIIGFVGNAMVIWVIVRSKDMRSSTYIFLVNLAIADLMVLLLWGNTSLLVYFNSELDTGPLSERLTCKVVSFLEVTVFHASILTILAIGFERYYSICQPLKAGFICTKNRAYTICSLTWILAALASCPRLLPAYYEHSVHVDGIHYIPACLDRVDSFSRSALIIGSSASLFFFLPLMLLTVIFLTISRHLKRAAMSSVNIAINKHRRSAITMLATVVLVFFVCHIPRRVLHLLILLGPPELQTRLGLEGTISLTFFCAMLVFLHSAMNPIVYNLMSERFRAGFTSICLDFVPGFMRLGRALCPRKDHTNIDTTQINTLSFQGQAVQR